MNLIEILVGIVVLTIFIVLFFKNKSKIIASLEKRIEKNAVKIPNLKWVDRVGKEHTEDIVIKKSNLPLIGDWSRIYPLTKEETTGIWYKDIIWINLIFGGKRNLIKLIIILLIMGLILSSFAEVFANYNILKESCEPYLSILGQ